MSLRFSIPINFRLLICGKPYIQRINLSNHHYSYSTTQQLIMKQLLFTFLICCTCAIASFGQPKPEDSTASNQKFYFPVSLYDNPTALDKAIPSLAEKV